MAIAFDASTESIQAVGVASFTFAHVCTGSNRVLLVFVQWDPGLETITGITYNGVALTQIGAAQSQYRTECWRLINPASGSNTVEVTFSVSSAVCIAAAISFTDVHQTTPEGTVATATGQDTAPTVTVTSATDELVVDGVSSKDVALTVNASQVERENNATGTIRSGVSTEAGAASVVMSWTLGATNKWAMVGVPLKPAPAVATNWLMLLGVGS